MFFQILYQIFFFDTKKWVLINSLCSETLESDDFYDAIFWDPMIEKNLSQIICITLVTSLQLVALNKILGVFSDFVSKKKIIDTKKLF